MSALQNGLDKILNNFRSSGWNDWVDILIVAVAVYALIGLVRRTRAGQLARGATLILAVYALAFYFNLRTLTWILNNVLQVGFLALVVVFQPELRRALEQLPRLFRHLYTVVLLWLTLVIFGAPGLSEGLAVLKGIFTWQSGAKGYTLAAFADTKLLLILAASFLLCGPVQALCPKLKAALYAKKVQSPAGMAGLLVLLFLGLMRVTAGTYSAFIYFQF